MAFPSFPVLKFLSYSVGTLLAPEPPLRNIIFCGNLVLNTAGKFTSSGVSTANVKIELNELYACKGLVTLLGDLIF